MLPDVGMVQMYSKSANVNDLGGPALLLVPTVFLPGGLPWVRGSFRHSFLKLVPLKRKIEKRLEVRISFLVFSYSPLEA